MHDSVSPTEKSEKKREKNGKKYSKKKMVSEKKLPIIYPDTQW